MLGSMKQADIIEYIPYSVVPPMFLMTGNPSCFRAFPSFTNFANPGSAIFQPFL